MRSPHYSTLGRWRPCLAPRREIRCFHCTAHPMWLLSCLGCLIPDHDILSGPSIVYVAFRGRKISGQEYLDLVCVLSFINRPISQQTLFRGSRLWKVGKADPLRRSDKTSYAVLPGCRSWGAIESPPWFPAQGLVVRLGATRNTLHQTLGSKQSGLPKPGQGLCFAFTKATFV